MDVYLPIANLAVNGLVIVLLGATTGVLSGIFGVGGGFLTTPLLIFYGIPTVTGASISGLFAYARRNAVDYQMGAVMVAGGIVGTLLGTGLFRLLESIGQIDTAINILYVVLLGTIGSLMGRESLQALRPKEGTPRRAAKRRHHPLVSSLPMRWRFYRSGLYISPFAPLILGVVIGILTTLMGVGGGFILVPAMLYLLGMSAGVVVGTSLFQILFTTIAATMMHALTTHAVDIVLAGLLLLGSVTGAQVGAKIAVSAKPELLRLILSIIVLAVAIAMAFQLGVRPREVFSVVAS